jgi:hypothetical protein
MEEARRRMYAAHQRLGRLALNDSCDGWRMVSRNSWVLREERKIRDANL